MIGECLVTTGENLTTTSCVHFSSGCPDDFFWDYDFFKCTYIAFLF